MHLGSLMWCDWNSNQEIWRGVAMLRGWNHIYHPTIPTFWWFLGTCLGSCSNDHLGPLGLFRSFFAASLSKSRFGSPWKLEIDVMPTFLYDWTDGKTKWKIHFLCPFSGRITFSQFQFSREICKQQYLYHFPIFHSLHFLSGFTPKCIMDFMKWIIQHVYHFHPWPLRIFGFWQCHVTAGHRACAPALLSDCCRWCCRPRFGGWAVFQIAPKVLPWMPPWACHTMLLLGDTENLDFFWSENRNNVEENKQLEPEDDLISKGVSFLIPC